MAKATTEQHQETLARTEDGGSALDAHSEGVAAAGHGEHTGEADYGAGHGPELGRYIEHPPEPPHLIQIWYKLEQKKLAKEYVEKHPGDAKPSVVEKWVEWDEETQEWVEVEGEQPTAAQVLHAGTLKEKMPLIGYGPWENHIYLGLSGIVLILIFWLATASMRRDRKRALRYPSRGQVFIEYIVGSFDSFCKGLLGEENGRRYMPFIGTLFCLILTGNLMGLVPLLRAPTSSVLITFSLALCTFLVTQGTAWIKLGPLTYIHHLMGSPRDVVGWILSPLFLILEIISDFIAKPLSLALRLFGNILGKDILLGAFLGMGIALMGAISEPLANYIGFPLTIPFYFLGILLSTIQALVFALLSTIYISLVLPHDHEHHDDEEEVISEYHHVGSAQTATPA